jgi:hypothetical protein
VGKNKLFPAGRLFPVLYDLGFSLIYRLLAKGMF